MYFRVNSVYFIDNERIEISRKEREDIEKFLRTFHDVEELENFAFHLSLKNIRKNKLDSLHDDEIRNKYKELERLLFFNK